MSVIVYVWLAKKLNVGHTSLEIPGHSSENTTYISWWPERGHNVYALTWCTPSSPLGEKSDDISSEGKEPEYSLSIPSGALDETSIAAWWKKILVDVHKKYCLLSFNCCDVVYMALQAGAAGEYIPNRYWIEGIHLFTPEGILEYVLRLQKAIDWSKTATKKGEPDIPGIGDGGLPPGGAP